MKLHFGRKALLTLVTIMAWAAPALAIDELQLYIEGGTYDASTQTWITSATNFKLWVIGDVSKKGTIFDVHIAAAYLTGELGSITLTPTTTSLLGALGDLSTPSAPTQNLAVGADGTVPVMDNGQDLPSHGIYGGGVSFKQYDIGDLNLTDSPIGDFSGATPFPSSFPDQGQVNVYDVNVTGYSMVHFDAFNHIQARTRAMSVFAPFSHDAETVPEPASLLLLGFGIGGSALVGLRRRVKR
jgi:PEP-CTERM motif